MALSWLYSIVVSSKQYQWRCNWTWVILKPCPFRSANTKVTLTATFYCFHYLAHVWANSWHYTKSNTDTFHLEITIFAPKYTNLKKITLRDWGKKHISKKLFVPMLSDSRLGVRNIKSFISFWQSFDSSVLKSCEKATAKSDSFF